MVYGISLYGIWYISYTNAMVYDIYDISGIGIR